LKASIIASAVSFVSPGCRRIDSAIIADLSKIISSLVSDGAPLGGDASETFRFFSRDSLNFSAIACAKSWSYWERELSDELGDGFEVLEICLEDMICPSALVLLPRWRGAQVGD
jgi:hypothetical protein